jgi:hopene-associated glycosyltransferase HpnB
MHLPAVCLPRWELHPVPESLQQRHRRPLGIREQRVGQASGKQRDPRHITQDRVHCRQPSRRPEPAAPGTELPEAAVLTICVLTTAAAAAWLYLLVLHSGYWRTSHRLPPETHGQLPSVTVVIPARNEADMLPACLPSLLSQDYSGRLRVIVVDDDSSDGTAAIAAALGNAASPGPEAAGLPAADLTVVATRPTPPGWAGKVWAMAEGVRAADPGAEYILFTDADIAYAPGTVARLARCATAGDFAMVSQMALLRTASRWEKVLIPAFVYFFAQLYPFARISRPRARTAAAAGGCMLVRADALAAAGGLSRIGGARIDDVALGKLLKRAGGRCWLGLTTDVTSARSYGQLADIWNMVARSAYTQLHYSLAATAGAVLGLAWLYLLPPAAAIAGLVMLGTGASPGASYTAMWLAAAGAGGWLVMAVTYLPMLRLYRLSPLRAPSLPLIAALYAAMTADSAVRHLRGRGGEWKGRLIQPPASPSV